MILAREGMGSENETKKSLHSDVEGNEPTENETKKSLHSDK